MPTYDYRCPKCEHRFELFHSMSDDKPKRCPKCRTRAVRVPGGGAGLLFKGSGFYITDYRSKAYKDRARADKAGGGGGEGGKTGKGGDKGGDKGGGKGGKSTGDA